MEPLETLRLLKPALAILGLALLWGWESWRPFFGWPGRWPHAGRNLLLAVGNTLLIALLFGLPLALVSGWAADRGAGLIRVAALPAWAGWIVALVALDLWTYVWHLLNHQVPLLWRFHRVHHSDVHLDVTTATRFHAGELTGSAVARLVIVPALGIDLTQVLAYELALTAVTQFHHADISLGRWDRWLRWLVVTPDMHKVHHSRQPHEFNSNYSSVLSVWDRITGTFVMREDVKSLSLGLPGFDAPRWQTFPALLWMPFAGLGRASRQPTFTPPAHTAPR